MSRAQKMQSVCPACLLWISESCWRDHVIGEHVSDGICPFCDQDFGELMHLAVHVDVHFEACKPETTAECDYLLCPICSRTADSHTELENHVQSHFSSPDSKNGDELLAKELHSNMTKEDMEFLQRDRALAQQLMEQDAASQKKKEDYNFSKLQTEYGMAGPSARRQNDDDMRREVNKGKLTSGEYYDQKIDMAIARETGIESSSSVTQGIISRLQLYFSSRNPESCHFCFSCDHVAVSNFDRGWGCGYRNLQMLLSSLVMHPPYCQAVFNGMQLIPDVEKLQGMIENAWRLGFDTQGADQLNHKLVNTRKWIGATEIVAFLSSLHVRTRLIDFYKPTDNNGGHPRLVDWVVKYFQRKDDVKTPLYLQHQGHSRTIVGAVVKSGRAQLLMFDPSWSKPQMTKWLGQSDLGKPFCRNFNDFRATKYQIVEVCGLMADAEEHKNAKVLRSIRIP